MIGGMKSTFDLEGKRVLVTGGTRGIGLGIARAFAEQGARVAVAARDLAAARRTAEELSVTEGVQCFGVSMDVAQAASVDAGFRALADEFGGLDVLVNNAGTANSFAFSDLDEDAWDRVMDTNLKGVYRCCRAGLGFMQTGGAVVNIAHTLS